MTQDLSDLKLTTRRLYRCHECDDWKPNIYCADCGTRCVVYVRPRSTSGPSFTTLGGSEHER